MREALKYPLGSTSVERVRMLKAQRRRDGLCVDCGKVNDRPTRTRCTRCASKESVQAKHRYRYAPQAEESRAKSKVDRRDRKAAVLARYGGSCACCGETQMEFLTIDHANNDGAAHRRGALGYPYKTGGGAFYFWLLKQPVLPGLRVLCWNCNCARGSYGVCPHEQARSQGSAA